jgi:hypothetical protein
LTAERDSLKASIPPDSNSQRLAEQFEVLREEKAVLEKALANEQASKSQDADPAQTALIVRGKFVASGYCLQSALRRPPSEKKETSCYWKSKAG